MTGTEQVAEQFHGEHDGRGDAEHRVQRVVAARRQWNADFYRARRAASHDMQRYAVQPQRITSSPKSLPPPGEGARRADGGTVHTSTYPHTRSPQLCRNT
ncbi:hypothetical protein XHV734_4752 [Xanthomonas hortorum pv. vitians]|nr:hypothetical protein XHV734_4752 [Xanthomonas hortorum pv. vitians]